MRGLLDERLDAAGDATDAPMGSELLDISPSSDDDLASAISLSPHEQPHDESAAHALFGGSLREEEGMSREPPDFVSPVSSRGHRPIRFIVLLAIVLIGVGIGALIYKYPLPDSDVEPDLPASKLDIATAEAHFNTGDMKRAAGILKQLVGLFPNHFEARLLLGKIHFKARRNKFAIKEFERARAIDDRELPIEYLRLYVESLILSGDIRAARAVIYPSRFIRSIDRDYLLSLCFLKEADYRAAKELLVHAIAKVNKDTNNIELARLHYLLSQTEFSLGAQDSSRDAIERALAISSNQPDFWTHLGGIELKAEAYAKAKDAFATAIDHEPLHIGAILGISQVLIHDKLYDDAFQWIEKIPTTDKNNEARFIQATIYRGLGEIREATEQLEEVLNSDPSHERSLYLLAELKNEAGNYNQAFELVKKLLTVNPDHLEAASLKRLLVSKL